MIGKRDLEHIGWLARLELSEEDKEKYTPKLNMILDYFGEIDKADTEGVEPSYHVLPMSNVFRKMSRQDHCPRKKRFQMPRRTRMDS